MAEAQALAAFLARHPDCALVEVIEARGSTPREAGAWMLVAENATFGTIGGGQLEWIATDEARRVLAGAARTGAAGFLDIPLGPEIGQCCGGRVGLAVKRLDANARAELVDAASRAEAARPEALLFGGGHVGHALAAALALLPFKVSVLETRAAALEGLPAGVERRLMAVPEAAVREARPGTAFVVLTHDHALDFLLVAEALKREDAAYVGMIGSQTKRATFRRWFRDEAGGSDSAMRALTCPIGASALRDKRPAVIAALAAAEIATALLGGGDAAGLKTSAIEART